MRPDSAETALALRAGRANYWRSLRELARDPEFQAQAEREFPAHADEPPEGTSRRDFLKVMGASLALAGFAGCRWPREEILPFAHRPMGRDPGVPVRYATTMDLGGVGTGLLVTSYDGRPIKITGNPEHPGSRGGTDAIAQASVLELYDPDRSRGYIERQGRDEFTRGKDDFVAFARQHFGALRASRGAGLRMIAPASSSPTLARLRGEFAAAYPEAYWVEWEALSRDHEREGSAIAFGAPYRTHFSLDRALVIVSLDADFLLEHPASVAWSRDFAAGRRADDGVMNRLWAVEPGFTITGARADHRLAAAAGEIPAIAAALAAEVLGTLGAGSAGRDAAPALAAYRGSLPPAATEVVRAMARDLTASQGRGVVIVGPRQPAAVHAIAHLLNAALSNAGSTVRYTPDAADALRPPHAMAIRGLAGEMNAGAVKTLVVLGSNPAYDAPADLAFGAAMAKVETVIHLGLHRDETARLARWHAPMAHYLESWGDARAWDGTLSAVQPLIEPLYDGLSAIELVALAGGAADPRGHELVMTTWRGMFGGAGGPAAAGTTSGATSGATSGPASLAASAFDLFWRRALNDGVVRGTAYTPETPAVSGARVASAVSALPAPAGGDGAGGAGGGLEVVFTRDAKLHDGRFANNAWLQEMPEPMTKLTWDNAALIAPATAASLGLRTEDVIRVTLDGRSLDIACYVMPGHAPNSITLPLGYGREGVGRVADGAGANTYALRTAGAPWVARGASVAKTGARRRLATTHDHYAIDSVGTRSREERIPWLAREGTLAEYLRDPEFARERVEELPDAQLFPAHEYDGYKWGMAIDLSACTGCSACILSCVSENNIPVVGKKQVLKGREMHWIRVDRYFTGPADKPAVVHQPVTCHHCENAPCEQVCPVAATVHDSEGLNTMVYNRCIGTRYCNNNCPYKVRRFNWLSFTGHMTPLQKMVMNPEVTVRGRGVMEKCSFCVQRISTARIAAKNGGRSLADGEVIPACAESCPTQAIVFGDLNDSGSRVRRLHDHQRSYAMLAEINTRPRLKYLARLRNPAGNLPAGTVEEV